MNNQNIFEFVTTEEANYKAVPVTVAEGWDWSMAQHIKTAIFYKNGKLLTGNDDNKPVKNITRPILNLQYRAEGFDLKDIVLYVNDRYEYYKSLLVRKYHDKWAKENDIDTFIDEMVESYVDMGAALAKNVNQVRPEIVPLQRIAFCDQTDILSGPIAEKHFYSPDQLMEMSKNGWGDESRGATATLDKVIRLSQEKKKDKDGRESKTPGKYIEVYEIHGMFPKWWLENSYEAPQEDSYENEYTRQLHIICFYSKENGTKQGLCLFKGKEKESPYKLVLRDEIYGRALGMGGVEEISEDQVWTNLAMIRMKDMLDAASKVLFQTSDPQFKTRNKLRNLSNMEVLVTDTEKSISQINTTPVNMVLFEKSVADWETHAQQMASATDALLGESPASGTPFKLQDLISQQGQGLHEYRKGKLATFLAEIYRDWIIPYISREIAKGQEFIAELNLDELQTVADSLVICETNKIIKEMILSGQAIEDTQIEEFKASVRDQFMKGGNKKFMEIFKDEMKEAPLEVQVNIAGKQKDLSRMTDKLVNVFRQVFATFNPQTGTFAVFDDPRMGKIFNQILEYSDLEPMDFYMKPKPPQPALQTPGQVAPGQLNKQPVAVA